MVEVEKYRNGNPCEGRKFMFIESPILWKAFCFLSLGWVFEETSGNKWFFLRASLCSTWLSFLASPNMSQALDPRGLNWGRPPASSLGGEPCPRPGGAVCWNCAQGAAHASLASGLPGSSLNTKSDWLSLTEGIQLTGIGDTVGRKMTEELYWTDRNFSL